MAALKRLSGGALHTRKKKGLLSRDDRMLNDGWLTICALASSYPIKVVQLSSSNLTVHDKEQPSSSRQGHRSDIAHSQASFKLVIFRRFVRSEFGTPPKSTPGESITTAAGTRRRNSRQRRCEGHDDHCPWYKWPSPKPSSIRHPLAKRVASQLLLFLMFCPAG